jgi:hypothetical protein
MAFIRRERTEGFKEIDEANEIAFGRNNESKLVIRESRLNTGP